MAAVDSTSSVKPVAFDFMGLSTIPLVFALAQGILSPISATLVPSAPLDQGYRQMYNLEFSGAHNTFQTYAKVQSERSIRFDF